MDSTAGWVPRGAQAVACPVRACQDIDHFRWVLTDEAKGYLESGTPEAQVFNAVPPEGIAMAALKVRTCAVPRLHTPVRPVSCVS